MPHNVVFRFLNAQPLRTQKTLSLGCVDFLGAGRWPQSQSLQQQYAHFNAATLAQSHTWCWCKVHGLSCVEFCESWGASGAVQYAMHVT